MRVICEHDNSQMMRYYRGVIVPNIKQGLYNQGIRMNNGQVHDLLRQRSTVRTKSMSVLETTWTDADSTETLTKTIG